MTTPARYTAATLLVLSLVAGPAVGSVTVVTGPGPGIADYETPYGPWTAVQDPPVGGMLASPILVDDTYSAALTAIDSVPSGADIGYASVNGAGAASSSTGFYFDPSEDFSIAIDFDVEADASVGGGGIGFGIGEDVGGADSAGVALAIVNGAPFLFTTAARVGDVTQTPETIVSGFGHGRMFVSYEAATGDVTVGVNATKGTSAPGVVQTITAIQDQWSDAPLVASFFLRSQAADPIPELTSGSLSSVFSNFEVLSGTPIALGVPEPSTSVLFAGLALAGCLSRRRQPAD